MAHSAAALGNQQYGYVYLANAINNRPWKAVNIYISIISTFDWILETRNDESYQNMKFIVGRLIYILVSVLHIVKPYCWLKKEIAQWAIDDFNVKELNRLGKRTHERKKLIILIISIE